MKRDLEGKVVLLTGATEGIGKAAALELARRGAAVTLVGRNREKSERVRDQVAREGGGLAELLLGDLSKLADVRALAKAFRDGHKRLDVLVNNAGAIFTEHHVTTDGLEMTFALNHLSYFLLTVELLDLLRDTPGARVVSTSSGAHRTGKLDLATVAERRGQGAGLSAYADSKLANILFTAELARRLDGTGIFTGCFHPGFVQSGFGQNTSGLMKQTIGFAAKLFARTPEQGAETLVWLATSREPLDRTGVYWADKKPAKRSARAKDETLARDLWTLSERLAGVA